MSYFLKWPTFYIMSDLFVYFYLYQFKVKVCYPWLIYKKHPHSKKTHQLTLIYLFI